MSPNDEFAGDLGVAGWEYGNLTLEDKPLTPEMRPTIYLRAGLMRGLEQEAKLGVNPFKFGLVGGTDVHNSLTAIEEDNFFGKHLNQEPSPKRWEHVRKQGFGKTRYTWQLPRRRLRRRVGDGEHARGDLGRDEAQGGLRHLRHAHDGALLRRLGLPAAGPEEPQFRVGRLPEGRADGRRPHEGARRARRRRSWSRR